MTTRTRCAGHNVRQYLVEHALQQLPATQRAVVVVCDLEEMTAPEAAKMLGVNTNVVKSRLHRARAALRRVIAKEFEALGVEVDGTHNFECTQPIPVDPCMKRASFGASVIAVAACEQNASGLQTRVDAAAAPVRPRGPRAWASPRPLIGTRSRYSGLQSIRDVEAHR